MNRKYRSAGLIAAAFLLTAGVSVRPVMAYFTASVSASGGHELKLDFAATVPDEDFSDWTKDLKITNTGTEDCYVRVNAFAGAWYPLTWQDHSGGKWSEGADGYWYYTEILKPGMTASGISVTIDDTKADDDFQVIVVQECAPVPFGENGEALGWKHAVWSGKADVVRTESGEDI